MVVLYVAEKWTMTGERRHYWKVVTKECRYMADHKRDMDG